MNQSLTYKKLRDYILIVFVYLFFRMNSYFTRGSTIEQFLLIGRVAIIALSFLLIFRVRFIPNKSMIILTGGSSFWFFLTGLQNYSGAIDMSWAISMDLHLYQHLKLNGLLKRRTQTLFIFTRQIAMLLIYTLY